MFYFNRYNSCLSPCIFVVFITCVIYNLHVVYQYQERKKNKEEMLAEPVKVLPLEAYGDADIIEL